MGSTSTEKFLGVGLRQSPGIEIVEEGGSTAEIQSPSSTTQSRELSRQSNPQKFFSQGTRIAALDYGRARIGVAISDETKFLARPLICLPYTKKIYELLLKELSKHVPIETIVIGLPLQLNGKEGEMAQETRRFAEEFKKHLPFPILFWDERLSSLQADRTLKEAELSRKKRAALSDTMSATVILQSYLDAKAQP